MNAAQIEVEVAYALPERQWLKRLRLPAGSTVQMAVAASGVCEAFAIPRDAPLRVGVFSRPCELHQVLRGGDRVELYRPLAVDPKAARRARAATRSKR
ncbi:hypothetical protein SAMN04488038_1013 [Solimonas aquatica]|uniref:UPF0125 protein SAMN04488038_1013 n=1 Tax=Solimonas aquatica TaxID=489703 RepID=A0A1H8ZCT6_9GAMM|nr:RnfH family protein [Solimonas aquatica]SEP62239.1 hypothetical protein SAMN04488038_1013 [Solimonas aquatica]